MLLFCCVRIIDYREKGQVVKATNANVDNKIYDHLNELMAKGKVAVNWGDPSKYDLSQMEARPYVNTMGVLMYPALQFREDFDCAVNIYTHGKIEIEKGNTTIRMDIGSNLMRIEKKEYQMDSPAYRKDDVLYLPLNNVLDKFEEKATWDKTSGDLIVSNNSRSTGLPESYDYREKKKDTPVKNQGELNTCWAFAAIEAVESSLMPDFKKSLSVDHMVYNNGYDVDEMTGGDVSLAIAYMSRFKGPVTEKADPYGDFFTNKKAKTVAYLKRATFIQSKDMQKIKSNIYKYGGVQTSLYFNMVDNAGGDYYNWDHSSYYCDTKMDTNHDVVIIGWDDHYSKKNFNKAPKEDGAFICKNSWGEGFGDAGYFYVSYEDVNMAQSSTVYNQLTTKKEYDKVFESDRLGYVGQMGFNAQGAYMANVYTNGDKKMYLQAVGMYALGTKSSYEISVVHNFEKPENLSNPVLIASGNLEEAGYYNVKLGDDVELEPNERYAIIVHINTPQTQNPIAVEYATDGRAHTANIKDGEGYVSHSGNEWQRTETTLNCNVCLKAFASYKKVNAD